MLFVSRFLQRRAQPIQAPAGQPENANRAIAENQASADSQSVPASPSVPPMPTPNTSAAVPMTSVTDVQAAVVPDIPAEAQGEDSAPVPRRAPRPQQRPPVPLGNRLLLLAGGFEQFIVRHRTTAALVCAYCTFFWRLYDAAGKFGAVGPGHIGTDWPAGSTFLDADKEIPLTRASVLSRVNSQDKAARRAGAGMRRESAKPAMEVSEHDDPMVVIEAALNVAASEQDPLRRAQLLSQAYAGLGNMHSARGHYYEMLHAMSLALRSTADAGDVDAMSELQVSLGSLELKHHRYYAAGTRFEDALATAANNETRAKALAGLGWAAFSQGGVHAAGNRFLQALGQTPRLPQDSSTSTEPALEWMHQHGCRAQHDGIDAARTLALAGLGLVNIRRTGSKDSSEALLGCAAGIFRRLASPLQESFTWNILGVAHHALLQESSAKRYISRAAQKGREGLLASATVMNSSEAGMMCHSAADLPLCSHTILYMSLVDFTAGNLSTASAQVDSLLANSHRISAEAAEWLSRFAKAHAWVPSGQDFGAFLLSRVEPLLQSEGYSALAQHFVSFGRFLLAESDRPSRLRRALTQLRRAKDIIEKTDIGWSEAEVAALYSTMGSAELKDGQIEAAIRTFEVALEHSQRSMEEDAKPQLKRLLLSYANLGAAKIKLAGQNMQKWRMALTHFADGNRQALAAGLNSSDPVLLQLQDSYRNAMRLAHQSGVLQTCPGPLASLLHGDLCPVRAEVTP